MEYAVIGFLGFAIGLFAGTLIGGALVLIGSKDDDTIPWNKEWDE
jgi:hypothetical protein